MENAKWMVKPTQVALIFSLLVVSEGPSQLPKAMAVLFKGSASDRARGRPEQGCHSFRSAADAWGHTG